MKQPPHHQTSVTTPVVKPLSLRNRTVLFLFCVVAFVVSVPLFFFYATGYRFDFFEEDGGVVVTGGLYIGMQTDQGEIYLNDTLVRGSRLFRRGSYIQNVMPGIQEVYVRAPGLQTWVKNLPISPYIVTEAEAFLMPVTPQIRVVTPALDSNGLPVIEEESPIVTLLQTASSTQTFVFASSTLAAGYTINPEFTLLEALFTPASSTATTTTAEPPAAAFTFSRGEMELMATSVTATATTTIIREQMSLFERDQQLFARYSGPAGSIPHYFCVPVATLASTSVLYGTHVGYQIEQKLTGPVPMATESYDTADRLCRNEIRIDTRFQAPRSFHFLPGLPDYVLLHINEGVFVVEIDDRSWQNVQQVYPASAGAVIVDNNRIYIREDGVFVELYTALLLP